MTTHAATPAALALASDSDSDDMFADVSASEIETFEKPAVRLSGLRSVPDFAFTADVLRATYSDVPSEDGVWSALLDAVNASDDVRAYMNDGAGIGGA